jgi:hypothetical protein
LTKQPPFFAKQDQCTKDRREGGDLVCANVRNCVDVWWPFP